MLFWLATGGLALSAVAILLAPLVRPPRDAAARADYDIEIYRDQLDELERDRARGLIDGANAEAARREIGRKLLAADATRQEPPPSRSGRHHAIIAVVALLVPALAALLYLDRGTPGLPDQPLAARLDRLMPDDIDGEAVLLARVEALRAHLRDAPEDTDSWLQLGGSLLVLGSDDEAVEAYRQALAASGSRPDIASLLGEALVRSANGVVTESAHRAFEQALAGQPNDPRARFYIALSEFQAGRYEQALAGWQALSADAPAGAPWLGPVEARIRAAAEALGRDGDEAVAEARGAAPPGPDAAALEAARDMSAEEQAAMVQTMVARLAARLQDEPDDLDGWLRLGRAYGVLEEHDKAIEAYFRAAALAPQRLEVQVDYAHALLKTVDASGALPERLVTVMQAIEGLDPDHPEALWFLGVADAQAGRTQAAAARWRRLLAQMSPDGEGYTLVARELEALETPP